MKKIKLALITGGRSNEREVALAGAEAIEKALDKQRFEIKKYDMASDLELIVREAEKIDFAFLIVHGEKGEDGRLQGFLDMLDIPYQGSGVLSSALAFNKLAAKKIFKANNIKTPKWESFKEYSQKLEERLIEKIGLPMFIKPAHGGSSLGISLVDKREDIKQAVDKCLDSCWEGLAEPCIEGRELSCAVIGNEDIRALPLIEIRSNDKFSFFDYTAKYTPGAIEEICPAPLSQELSEKIQNIAIRAHKSLYCKDYSRSDFILEGDEAYILETNTLPGMTETSLLPLAAKTAGLGFAELIEELIMMNIKK